MTEESVKKLAEPDFVVRLVGSGVKPWTMPMRALSRVLAAVQRLVEQKEEEDGGEVKKSPDPVKSDENSRVLHLVSVKSSSAAYAVAAPSPQLALRILGDLNGALSQPEHATWTFSTLQSLRELSEIAKSLGVEIEFRERSKTRSLGNVIAKITPLSYSRVKTSAFIRGRTSVFAKIERVGGATGMHCGIRLQNAPRKMVICRVASEELVRELGRFMYQYVMLSGSAVWLRHSWRLRQMKIDSFDPPKTGSAIDALRKARKAGAHAWDDVDDPEGLIAELRGS